MTDCSEKPPIYRIALCGYDLVVAEGMEELQHGSVQGGVLPVGCDLGERREDEAAFVQGGVREREHRVVADGIAVEQQVEVDDARAFGWGVRAVAAHGVLDGEKAAEEVGRGDLCFQERGGVGEPGLVGVADGFGLVKAGDCGDPAEVLETAQCFEEVIARGAEA